MKYFQIHNSCNFKEIGFAPQVHSALVEYNIYEKNSSYNLNISKSSTETLWPIPKLSNKAKITDLISTSFMGLSQFVMSDKLKNIILKGNVNGIEFIETKLITKKETLENFWIINPFELHFDFLNFENTEFVFKNRINYEIMKRIKFSSLKDFLSTLDDNKNNAIENNANFEPLQIDKIVFTSMTNADFFCIDRVYSGIGYYVSEDLKNKIAEQGCTGLVFTDPNERYP